MSGRGRFASCAIALIIALSMASTLSAQRMRSVRAPQTLGVTPEPAACQLTPALAPELCNEGAANVLSLRDDEVELIVRAAARALNVNTLTIAVVDRAGRPLAVFRKPDAIPARDDEAIGVARTAAFFSHDMAPLSSRTVRFISGVHFPPGITNTPSAALYGIENTNRGCDFNVVFNPGKCIPRAKRFGLAVPCASDNNGGCGSGIVTGKVLPDDSDPSAVNAGGIPLYRILDTSRVDEGIVRGGKLIGAIGVVGVPGDPQLAEFAAASGAFGALGSALGPIVPVPQYPLPHPGNVFIDGIRLPFLGPDLRLEINGDGLPVGVRRLKGTSAGNDNGAFVYAPRHGGCAANGYLAGPRAGSRLSVMDVDAIVQRAIATAKRTRAAIRLPLNSYARMVIAVGDVDGSILALYRMPDATVFSVDVAVAKARNVVWFSTSADLPVPGGTAVSNRTIGFGAQPFYPPGIDSDVLSDDEGPWYRSLFLRDLANPCSQGTQPVNPNQNGIVFFAGSTPLYRDGALAGGLGISGDGIEQDDYVAYHAAGELLPPQSTWADRVKVDGARLPMFKFPRQPEGVTECGGGPCN
jgi:uncharacterized protein GlcG (DUF336 family)